MRRPAQLVVAVDDRAGKGGAAAAAGYGPEGRLVVWGQVFPTRRAALSWAELLEPAELLVGPVLKSDVNDARVVSQTDATAALAKLRELVSSGQVVHDGGHDLTVQLCSMRVAERVGGLTISIPGAWDLARCASWALWAAAAAPKPRANWLMA